MLRNTNRVRVSEDKGTATSPTSKTVARTPVLPEKEVSSKNSQTFVSMASSEPMECRPRPSIHLEIVKGRTRFPLRPMRTERYLIGQSDQCDLQLGGGGMPSLHSTIYFDGEELFIDAVASKPDLRINGEISQHAFIQPGDRIAVGEIEFVVHVSTSPSAVVPEATRPVANSAHEVDPEELSAEALVDLIGEEMELVERFEGRQKLGLAAMLEQLSDRPLESSQEPHAIEIPERGIKNGSLLNHMEGVIRELNDVSHELELHTTTARQRDARYLETMASLIEVQQRLTAKVDGLVQQVEAMKLNSKEMRASA